MVVLVVLTGGGDGARCRVEDVAKHLGLCDGGIADEQDVDVASKPRSVGKDLLHTAQQHAENRLQGAKIMRTH